MFEYTITRQSVKLTLLDEQIRANATLTGFTGLSQRGDTVQAHFDQVPPKSVLDTLDTIISAHDPTALTQAEQAEQAAQTYAATLKSHWYGIVTADPAQIESDLRTVQVKLAQADLALQQGDAQTSMTRMLEAQAISAQLGQTAMQHLLVLTRVVREIMRRGAGTDLLTDPEQL
jgi:hypothetical protein